MKKLISFLIFLTLLILSMWSLDAEAQVRKQRVIIKPEPCHKTVWVKSHWVWNRQHQRHTWVGIESSVGALTN